ncbi:MAG: (2Fe-2S)-binding protein [Anaerolineales bacterium]|jgi:carbon-monoxide dehydrogenase small subunit
MTHHTITFTLNGTQEIREVRSNLTLLRFLREQLGVMGVKSGCDTGECGACTVLLNNEPVNACLVLAVEVDGGEVITVEGLSSDDQLDPLQQAFIEHNGIQCGFCTPGVLISARALLNRNPHPSKAEIKDALRGNLCRCTGYVRIIDAVEAVVKEGS